MKKWINLSCVDDNIRWILKIVLTFGFLSDVYFMSAACTSSPKSSDTSKMSIIHSKLFVRQDALVYPRHFSIIGFKTGMRISLRISGLLF